jgi:uncharacterized membrane protein
MRRVSSKPEPRAARDPFVASAVGAVVVVLTTLLPWVHFGDRVNLGDVRHYRHIAEQILDGRVPYHQFFVEYPPGALPIFLLPTAFAHSVGDYGIAFRVSAAVVTVIAVAAVVWTLSSMSAQRGRMVAAAAFVGVSPALLGAVYFGRYDIWAAAITSLALLALLRGRYSTTAVILGLGAATKVYPVLLIPLLLMIVARRVRLRAAVRTAVIAASVFVVCLVPFAVRGFSGVGYSFKIQLTRVLEIESLGAAVLLAAHQLGAYHPTIYSGLSFQLTGHLPDAVGILQTLLLVAGLLTAYWAFWLSAQTPDDVALAAAAVLSVTVAFDKVLSPQYLVWLVPVVALLWGRVGAVAWSLLAGAMVLTASYFPSHFRDLRHGGSSVWIVLGRDVVLVGLAVFLVTVAVRRVSAASGPVAAQGVVHEF